MAYLLQLIDLLYSGRCREISPTEHATMRLESERVARRGRPSGRPGAEAGISTTAGTGSWPWSMQRFRDVMQTPTLEAFELA